MMMAPGASNRMAVDTTVAEVETSTLFMIV